MVENGGKLARVRGESLTRAGGYDGRLAYRIRISSSIISSAAVMIRVAAE